MNRRRAGEGKGKEEKGMKGERPRKMAKHPGWKRDRKKKRGKEGVGEVERSG